MKLIGGTSRNLSGKEGDVTALANLVSLCMEQVDKALTEKGMVKEVDTENAGEISVSRSS